MNIQQALDDLMAVYAPAYDGTAAQDAARHITDNGGMLAYIADIKAAVKELQDEK